MLLGPQIVSKGYLTLPDGCRVKVYEQPEYGQLMLTKQFRKLWEYFADYGESLNRGGFVLTNIPSPASLVSNLVGVSFLSDNNSAVRVILFELLDSNGPIISDGFELNVFSQALKYRVSWSISGPKVNKNINIAFYTTSDANYLQTAKLFLICGSKGASFFHGETYGSFSFSGQQRIYVAVDQEVIVTLRIETYRRASLVVPNITYIDPLVQCITVTSPCNSYDPCNPCNSCDGQFTLPAFTIVSTVENKYLIKEPTDQFASIAALITAYLDLTALSITLWEESIIGKNLVLRAPGPVYTFIDLLVIQAGFYIYAYSSMITNGRGQDFLVPINIGKFDYLFSFQLIPKTGVQALITYDINLELRVLGRIPFLPIISCEWSAGRFADYTYWRQHTRINQMTGQEDGLCQQPFPFPPGSLIGTIIPAVGSFLLKSNAVDFNIRQYVEPNINSRVAPVLMTINKITVQYVLSTFPIQT
jgi:hypothetical protein